MTTYLAKHRDGYCISAVGLFAEDTYSVPTLCQHHVILPWGIEVLSDDTRSQINSGFPIAPNNWGLFIANKKAGFEPAGVVVIF